MRKNRAVIVGDELQKVLSDIISNKVKNPHIPLLTSVTAVRMSSDLTHANVSISVFGDEKTQQNCMKALEKAKGFIRFEMCKQVKLRVDPELHFKLDTSLEDVARMDAAIDRILAEDRQIRIDHGVEEEEE